MYCFYYDTITFLRNRYAFSFLFFLPFLISSLDNIDLMSVHDHLDWELRGVSFGSASFLMHSFS